MARVNTLDLGVERTVSNAESDRVIGGGGFGVAVGGRSVYVGNGYGGYGYRGPGYGHRYGGHGVAPHSWHSTTHYDYHPGRINRHGSHYHYQPGHYDLHRSGHLHHNH